MLQVYIGYDPRESVAFYTLAHSIFARASVPVSIAALMRRHLAHLYRRPRGPTEATEFSMTRFLVPALSDYRGWSIFMDCDMLCLDDITRLPSLLDTTPDCDGAAVCCCKHDYQPREGAKFLGHQQTAYPRKNWSSFMALNCAKCEKLTVDYVNTASGLELHRMLWADEKIGSIPLEWNWLVGEYNTAVEAPSVLHYTLGGPWFDEYRHCDFADAWRDEFNDMKAPYVG